MREVLYHATALNTFIFFIKLAVLSIIFYKKYFIKFTTKNDIY